MFRQLLQLVVPADINVAVCFEAWLKFAVAGLAGLSICMHAIGFAYSGDWGSTQLDFDAHPERL